MTRSGGTMALGKGMQRAGLRRHAYQQDRSQGPGLGPGAVPQWSCGTAVAGYLRHALDPWRAASMASRPTSWTSLAGSMSEPVRQRARGRHRARSSAQRTLLAFDGEGRIVLPEPLRDLRRHRATQACFIGTRPVLPDLAARGRPSPPGSRRSAAPADNLPRFTMRRAPARRRWRMSAPACAGHIPVLLDRGASPPWRLRDGETYVDGTFGGGGYSPALLDAADCLCHRHRPRSRGDRPRHALAARYRRPPDRDRGPLLRHGRVAGRGRCRGRSTASRSISASLPTRSTSPSAASRSASTARSTCAWTGGRAPPRWSTSCPRPNSPT